MSVRHVCSRCPVLPVFTGELSSLLLLDESLVLQIALVPTQHDVGVLAVRVHLQLACERKQRTLQRLAARFPDLTAKSEDVRVKRTHPVPDVEEALLVRQVEQQQETHGVSEEGRRQTPEPAKTKRCLTPSVWYRCASRAENNTFTHDTRGVKPLRYFTLRNLR